MIEAMLNKLTTMGK
ncbi:MAG: hypothetical protein AB8W37_03575 [Arsenophonus endosymbiont of Dermacentor nuttalli]